MPRFFRPTLERLEDRDLCDGAMATTVSTTLAGSQQETIRALDTTFTSDASSVASLEARQETLLAAAREDTDQISMINNRLAAMDLAAIAWGTNPGSGFDAKLNVATNHGRLNSTAVTPGGLMAGAYQDGTIEIRSAQTGQLLRSLTTGIGRALIVSANPTNELIYVSAGTGVGSALIAFNASTGQEQWRKGTGNFANHNTVSPDGTRVVVDVDDKGVLAFNAMTGAALGTVGPTSAYGGTALANDATLYFQQGKDVFVRDGNGSTRQLAGLNNLRNISSVAADGVTVAIAADSTVRVLNTVSGAILKTFSTDATVTQVEFLSDGSLAVGRQDGVLETWNGNFTTRTLSASASAYVRMIQQRGNALIIQTSEDAPVWFATATAQTRSERDALLAQRAALTSAQVTIGTELAALDAQIAIAREQEALRIAVFQEQSVESGGGLLDLGGMDLWADTLDSGIDEVMLLSALMPEQSPEAPTLHWPQATVAGWNAELLAGTEHGQLNDSTVLPSGMTALAYQDGTITILNRDGSVQHILQTGIGRAYCLAADAAADIVYVSAGAGPTSQLQAYDAITGVRLWALSTGNFTNRISVGPNSTLAVDIDERGPAIVDTRTGAIARQLPGAMSGATLVANGGLAYRNEQTGQVTYEHHGVVHDLGIMQSMINGIPTSSDGTRLAIIARTGAVRIIDTTTGNSILTFSVSDGVTSATFTSNSALSIGFQDGHLELYELGASAASVLVRNDARGHGTEHAVIRQIVAGGQLFVQSGYRDARILSMALQQTTDEAADDVVEAPSAPEHPVESAQPAASPLLAQEVIVEDSETSLRLTMHADAMALPGLLRRSAELAREIPTARSRDGAAQQELATATNYLAERQALSRQLRTDWDHARAAGDGLAAFTLERNFNAIQPSIIQAQDRLDAATHQAVTAAAALAGLLTEQQEILESITTIEERITATSAEFIALLSDGGMDGDTARASAVSLLAAATREGNDAMPHVRPNVTILDTNFAPGDSESYWLGSLTREVREHRSPILTLGGGVLKILARVTNTGNRSGVITVTGTGISDLYPDSPIQHTLEIALEPGESRDFVMTIGVPRGQSRPGSISLRASTLDEVEIRYDKLVQQPKSSEGAGYQQGGVSAAAHNLNVIAESLGGVGTAQERVNAMLASQPATSVALVHSIVSGTVAVTDAVRSAVEVALTDHDVQVALGVAEVRTVAEAGENDQVAEHLGIGGTDTALPPDAIAARDVFALRGNRAVFTEVTEWYDSGNAGLLSTLHIRRDTLVGQIMFGAANRLWQEQTAYGQWYAATALEIVTSIPAQKIVAARAAATTAQDFVARFEALLGEAQYGHLLASPVAALTPRIFAASTDRSPEHPYTDTDIRIRFDVALAGKDLTKVEVYDGDRKLATTTSATFVTVPLSDIGRSSSFLTLTLRVTLDDGTTLERQTTPFAVLATRAAASDTAETLGTADLSTLPEGELRTVENDILSGLTLPVHSGGWGSLFGSLAHDGRNLYAIDLGKDGDTGTPIILPSPGVIESVNLDDGRVIIRHTTASGVTWYSQFEHMTHILETVTGISYVSKKDAALLPTEERAAADLARSEAQTAINAYLAESELLGQNVQIGLLGNEGGYTTGSHLHFSVYHADRQTPVNLYRWLDAQQPGIVHSAKVGGNDQDLAFQWNDGAGALVNASERIALRSVDVADASSTNGIKPEQWAYAWEEGKTLEQMQRVVWKAVKYEGEALPQERWVMASDETQEWDAQERRFIVRKKA